MKIQKIEGDLVKNQQMIADIKNWVGLLAKGDDTALSNLLKILNEKSLVTSPETKEKSEKEIEVHVQNKDSTQAKDLNEQQKPGESHKEIYEIGPEVKSKVSGAMCSLANTNTAPSDINVSISFSLCSVSF